jgi:hypothetical protein
MEYATLISLVQNYEEIYNLKHPGYGNQQRRDNIWEEIAGIMKRTGQCNITHVFILNRASTVRIFPSLFFEEEAPLPASHYGRISYPSL